MIINGYNDFMQELERSASYLNAWESLYKQHEEVYQSLFHTLYHLPKGTVLASIRNDEMDEYISQLQQIDQDDTLQLIRKTLQTCDQFYCQEQLYDTYLLVGFGHIDGTAQWSDQMVRPFLFFGWERINKNSFAELVMHEYNHLIRFHALNLTQTEMTVGDLVIAEGLATLAPLIMKNRPLTEEQIQQALAISENDYLKLKENEAEIEADIRANFCKKLSREGMKAYFMANEDGKYKKSGYYIGVNLIVEKMKQGYSLKTLTRAKVNLFL
ncbi:hypothetical protein JCM19046_2889 [Bacillus sp. JCM 19046]|nr:hypothetical protein JCM19045_464 [Bacillus sp. JCM 19045]GAF18320.1 hypothetical protein JCM19046_2889 [Bacillus sp. JCM 19046]